MKQLATVVSGKHEFDMKYTDKQNEYYLQLFVDHSQCKIRRMFLHAVYVVKPCNNLPTDKITFSSLTYLFSYIHH